MTAMDPAAIAALWKQGIVCTLLLAAVIWLAIRDRKRERLADRRDRDCEERAKDLGARIAALEKRQFERVEDLVERAIPVLSGAAAVIRRALGDTVTPPAPLPTLHVHHPSDQR